MGDEQNVLAFIVDRLNDQPFQMQLTMVAFDEKSPFELLEVMNEVMAHSPLSTASTSATRRPTRRRSGCSTSSACSTTRCRRSSSRRWPSRPYCTATRSSSTRSSRMLHLPDLQKRAYLARFLVNVDVPEHMFADDEIVEVYQNLKDLQEEFKEVHKTSEKYKSQLISPNEIKKAIMQMEEDKGMLENKVESLKGSSRRSTATTTCSMRQRSSASSRTSR